VTTEILIVRHTSAGMGARVARLLRGPFFKAIGLPYNPSYITKSFSLLSLRHSPSMDASVSISAERDCFSASGGFQPSDAHNAKLEPPAHSPFATLAEASSLYLRSKRSQSTPSHLTNAETGAASLGYEILKSSWSDLERPVRGGFVAILGERAEGLASFAPCAALNFYFSPTTP